MELCKGEIEAYCTDILDSSLALILFTLRANIEHTFFNSEQGSKIEITAHNSEQYEAINKTIDDIMYNFTDYYYACGDNYTEHPYCYVDLQVGAELKDHYEHYYKNNPIFSVNYEQISETTTKIIFSIKDCNKCYEALNDYLEKYGYDVVFNDEANVLTYKSQEKQLYNLLTENDYNLNNFVVKELKYIKAICYNEYIKKLSILQIEINFNNNNELVSKCIIADNGFVENYGKTDALKGAERKTKTKTYKLTKARKHFSPAVQELYDYIKTYARLNDYQIYPPQLIGDKPDKICGNMGNLTSMVKRLNDQYREMILDETVTLMRYDKTLECYMIKDIWNN